MTEPFVDNAVDPNGLDAHTPGAKLDGGKLDLTLVPPEAIEAIAAVMEHGLRKYSRGGWKQVPDAKRRYQAALLRHMMALSRGEERDPHSGLPHVWHVATNAAFLCWFEEHPPVTMDPYVEAVVSQTVPLKR